MTNENIRIVVVDDTITYRKIIAEILSSLPNIEIVGTAANGKIALHKIHLLKPDLVTLDVSMPEASGTRFYRDIKADPELASIPVIIVTAVTGYAGDPHAYEKFIRGRRTVPPPDAFFPKPIDKTEFLETVHRLLA